MELSSILAIASLVMSAATTIWIGGFRMSALFHEVKNLGVRIDKLEDKMERRFERLESRMDNFQIEMHKIDIRVNTLENRKP
ncbi:MAG: hypothetical protein WDO14_03370 [Bacteroidota bacterium]